jgi:hypothetical protein
MAYEECETALVTLLRTLTTQFPTSAQVATDHIVLDSGITNAAVLNPGNVSTLTQSGPPYTRRWEILLYLYTQFIDEPVAVAAFKALRGAVILKIDQNPNLGGVSGVYDTVISSDGELYLSGPTPVYMAQKFRVIVSQYLTV